MSALVLVEWVLVRAAAEVPLWCCVCGALVVLAVCVPLSVAAEEETMDVRIIARPRVVAGAEARVQRAERALNELLAEIDSGERERVTAAVRTALLRSGALEAGVQR